MKSSFWIPAVLAAAVFAAAAPRARALDWLPVTEEDRAATASTIDPDAGAEILYRMEQIDNSDISESSMGTVTEEYVRIKVFNEKGVRRVSKTEIRYNDYESIATLDARVIKPDGTIIVVDKKSFFDRRGARSGSESSSKHSRSFSFPQLAPGDIAEYRVCKAARDAFLVADVLYFQSDLPTRHVLFRVKPRPRMRPNEGTAAYFHKCPQIKVVRASDGFSCVEMRDVPARKSEPHSYSPRDAQMWMMFYPTDTLGKPEEYWKKTGTELASEVDGLLKKASKLAREKAVALTAGAASAEEKLARLNDYCRQSILNVSEFPPPGGVDRKKMLAERRPPDELIQSGMGSSRDIPVLFIAMVRALGLDARIAMCADWGTGLFKTSFQYASFSMRGRIVAVRVGDGWKYYDPARCRVSTGTLHWLNEGNTALIATTKAVEWVVLPVTPPAQSRQLRTARLRVDEEGTLTGTVSIEYSGQALNRALDSYYKTEQPRITSQVRASVTGRIPAGKVSKVKVSGANDLSKPLKLTYEVNIPNYAERAGSRLFIQPSFFEKGVKNRFPDEKRVNDVFFQTNYQYVDDVTISVPAGAQIEEGSAPVSKAQDDWGAWGHYKASLAAKKSDSTIIYKRDFVFNRKIVPADKYRLVKAIHDHAFAQDAHVITLRGVAPGATAAPAAAPKQETRNSDEPDADDPEPDEPGRDDQ